MASAATIICARCGANIPESNAALHQLRCSGPPVGREPWTCQNCTFINGPVNGVDVDVTECEMCGVPRHAGVGVVLADVSPTSAADAADASPAAAADVAEPDLSQDRARDEQPPAQQPIDAQPTTLSRVVSRPVECAVCLDDLSDDRPVCALARDGQRSCRHFFHVQCARSMISSGHNQCPECREAFDTLRPLPSLSDADDWFNAIDDGSNVLSKLYLVEALAATCPLGRSELASVLDASDWDWEKPIDKTNFAQLIAPWLHGTSTTRQGLTRSLSQELITAFPDKSIDEVRAAVGASGGNAERAAELLLFSETTLRPTTRARAGPDDGIPSRWIVNNQYGAVITESEELTSARLARIEHGRVLEVAEYSRDGLRARVTNPVRGWINMAVIRRVDSQTA